MENTPFKRYSFCVSSVYNTHCSLWYSRIDLLFGILLPLQYLCVHVCSLITDTIYCT